MIVKAGKYLFLLIILLLLAGGCSRSAKDEVYISERNRSDYIELKSDGSFSLKEDGKRLPGTYEWNDRGVKFAFRTGETLGNRVGADSIIDNRGEIWTRWHGGKSGTEYERVLSDIQAESLTLERQYGEGKLSRREYEKKRLDIYVRNGLMSREQA